MADEDRLTRLEEIVASLLQVAREHNQVARQQNERLNALAQASRESDARIDKLAELFLSFDGRMDELREAQVNSDRKIAALADAQSEGILSGEAAKFTHIAVTKMPRSGKPYELLDDSGISAKQIVSAIKA